MVVLSNERVYSERTAEAVDEEVTDLLTRLESRALGVLAHNRRCLEELAQTLLTDVVLEGDRLRTLLRGASLPSEAAEAEETRSPAPPRVH